MVPMSSEAKPPEPTKSGPSLVPLLWGLVGGLLGVVAGAAGVGNSLIGNASSHARSPVEMAELNGRLDELRRDLKAREKELAAEREARKEAVSAARQASEAADWAKVAATLKDEFLSRFLAHEQARTDVSKAVLIDTVCGVWKQRQAARMSIATAPLELRDDQLRGVLRPEMEQFLLQNGVTAELLANARRTPSEVAMPAVTPYNVFEVQRAAQTRHRVLRQSHEAVAALQRQVQNIKIAKRVRFADGGEYRLPQEVALGMQSNKDCRSG